MGKIVFSSIIMIALILILTIGGCDAMSATILKDTLQLPDPKTDSGMPLEETLLKRRSIRSFSDESLSLEQISQLLWAAQGVTHQRGYRTAPSAGALYPLEIYVVAGQVKGLDAGIYRYIPQGHKLKKITDGDKREELCRAALNQSFVKNAPAVFILSAVYQRVTGKYGDRGIKYAFIEVGHASQNICLQAVALNLGTVVIGAFHDNHVKRIMVMDANEYPVYIIPAGRPEN